MGASLDTRKAHLTRQHGDIIAVYTWVNDERAMVLIPAYRPGAPWYIVMESAAFRYDDPTYLASQCAKACEVLGIEPSRPNWVRVATIIHEGLPDLIRMPSAPLPEQHAASIGSMQLRADGQVLAEQDVRLDKEGVQYG
ncbi:hypothetical protein [Quisquiliibacterium transsilvanicum]|uniref:Uncharacterized protein n=1 Tax=Quisquiliibacterium transsilvanicum TaxID=1549638 RepID=A0A7W8HHE2_9BURK|nr:hypothetical protein [Quisquiliibacterium transsilvanicum]MBB5271343.1 hypothetical protein [Quisquiliibacterium transsilvanicum]